MKKLLIILIAMILLSSCHGSKELNTFEVPESFDTSRHYEVVFWAKNDTNLTQVDIYNKAIADFEALYPNIDVNMRLYTDYGRIYNDVITNISTNTTPNVCISYPDHIATYLTGNNIVVPLSPLYSDPRYGLGGSELKYDGPDQDEMIEKFKDEGMLKGEYYALPFLRSSEACYINKDMVEALGYEIPEVLTWDFIFEVSEKAMAKDDEGNFLINGQKVLIPFIYKSTDNMMIQMLKQLDAGYADENGNISLFNDTTKEILYRIADQAEKKTFSTFKISSYPGNFLNAGQCIFAIDSTAGATWMGSNAPLMDIHESKKVDFDCVVKMLPQFDINNPKMISQGPSICIFNKDDPQEVLASWLFAQYLLTNEVQISYSQTEGYIPVTTKATESPEYLDYLSRKGEDNQLYYDIKIDAVNIIRDNIENTFITPVFNGSASLRDAAGYLIESVTKSVNRRQTVDEEYIDQLFEDTTDLYHLDQINISDSRADLGPMPAASITLIVSLIVIWILLGIYYLRDLTKNKR
ncbi:MAG: extracellular solute-binding protein [Erysipelotrichaceae bacterium]|nr:extracellular solute-binding protein [Erysipelotrichaceae bacterium]